MKKSFLLFAVSLICVMSFLFCACDNAEQEHTAYTVTFNYNYSGAPTGGVYKTETVDENTAVAKPATDPARTGYTFSKWYTDAACTTEYVFTTPVTAALYLYAGWTVSACTVTYRYNYDGAPTGGVYKTEAVNYNATATKPETDPTRPNYRFDGWYKTADAKAPFDFTSGVTGATNVYAKWALINDPVSVQRVKGLSNDFVMGVDASSVFSLENAGVKFYDYDGNEADVFKTLAENGVNTVRIRVWNDPFNADKKGYGGGNNDINAAIEMGKRVTKYGMGAYIDFHYSDFWADPGKQQAPKAWKDFTVAQKETAIYDFTKDSLNKLKAANVNVTMVQVGNETTSGMAGVYYKSDGWDKVAKLFNAGSRAVREVYTDAKVVVHFTNPEIAGHYANLAKQLNNNNVDYDVFASSWYPFWHGTLDNLKNVLSNVASTYNKQVLIAETSYAYMIEDSDFHTNTVCKGTNDDISANGGYEFSVQGQADLVRDAINTMAQTTNGLGVCYWEGTWISVGKATKAENQALWEKYGCGWASSYSGEYDADDAGKWYGGSAVDNQALFGADGRPLESLKVFKLVRGEETYNVYINGQITSDAWTTVKGGDIDSNIHTAAFTFTWSYIGEFGFKIFKDDDTDTQLCWIGRDGNVWMGSTQLSVTINDNTNNFSTSGEGNITITNAGTYKVTIVFADDNITPVSVTFDVVEAN